MTYMALPGPLSGTDSLALPPLPPLSACHLYPLTTAARLLEAEALAAWAEAELLDILAEEERAKQIKKQKDEAGE